ncbi:CPBP family intramembrane glutamic endopeptidase [Myceligenerans crystallogenes]|uniref:CPBP family intramembrane metalloprotease n=1 Tax=Myceligenerans crystallogenes TaxID=316335 RepID=A0ABP4ZXR3_9MICO
MTAVETGGVGVVAPPPASGRPGVAGLSYPQAWRGSARYRWWRPLLALAVMAGGGVVFFVFSGLSQIGAWAAYNLPGFLAAMSSTDTGGVLEDAAWLVSPLGMLSTNIALGIPIPFAMLAALVAAGSAGVASSVTGRLRWGLMLGAAVTTILVLVPLGFAMEAVAPSSGESLTIAPEAGWQLLAVVILLTTPLQAAGEEYFFRGWLTQVVGAWCRPAWLAVVLPMLVSATLFALAHGVQNPWLFGDRFFFGIVASLLVWRTGGLECAVALHVVNNLFAFGAAIATGTMEESLLITEVEPLSGILSMTGTAVTALVLLGFARWRTAQRLTAVAREGGLAHG